MDDQIDLVHGVNHICSSCRDEQSDCGGPQIKCGLDALKNNPVISLLRDNVTCSECLEAYHA